MQSQPHCPRECIRVLLINNNVIERSGLRALIDSRPGLEVAGEARDHAEALAIAADERPDIILLSFNMSSSSILNYIPEMLAIAGEARVLILTGARDPKVHQRAIHLGAIGLVLKDEPAETLIKAIQKVHAGEVWLDRATTANVLAKMSRLGSQADSEAAKVAALTDREREIIDVVCEGLKNKQIAARLFISEATVRHHLTSIFSKLGVADRFDLMFYAYRHSLAIPPS